MLILFLAASLIAGYLLGSINSSVLVGRFFGVDIRKKGSGNAGATNTLRTLGKKAAVIVFIGDALKAVVAILLARLFAFLLFPEDVNTSLYAQYLASFGAVLGHNFPVYFGFKGGKGIVTSIACITTLEWRIGLILIVIGVGLIILTRFVSLGSIAGAIGYPVCVIAFHAKSEAENVPYYIALSVAMGILAVYRHRANIVRLIKGTESKLGAKK